MRLVVTCNGPGEAAGWLRPLLRALYDQSPDADVHVFFVPDDYATGEEPAFVRSLFPQAHVYDRKAYVRVALGARYDGVPSGTEAVLYLGRDLIHFARQQRRFGAATLTSTFSSRRYAHRTHHAFAVLDPNPHRFRKD